MIENVSCTHEYYNDIVIYCYSGSVDGNNQLIIKGKFQQKQIETVLRRYISKSVKVNV
jgi:translation initiation factor 2 beta subunit (eIF-2beta)/eIF-5